MWNGKMKALTFSYDDGVEQDLSRVNAEIARLRQNARVCPLCGADARSGDAFCRNCGTRL